MNPDIRKVFVLSTAHLTKETADKHSYISDDPISAAHLDGHRPRRPQLRAFDDLQQPSLTQ